MKFLLSSKYFIKGGNENVKQKKRTEIKEPIILCLMWLNTKSLADLKNVYPGHTNIIVATISDPDLSKIPASKVSATSSNPSVLKVIDKYNIDFANYHPNMDIGIEIEAMNCFYKEKEGDNAHGLSLLHERFCNRSWKRTKY